MLGRAVSFYAFHIRKGEGYNHHFPQRRAPLLLYFWQGRRPFPSHIYGKWRRRRRVLERTSKDERRRPISRLSEDRGYGILGFSTFPRLFSLTYIDGCIRFPKKRFFSFFFPVKKRGFPLLYGTHKHLDISFTILSRKFISNWSDWGNEGTHLEWRKEREKLDLAIKEVCPNKSLIKDRPAQFVPYTHLSFPH